MGMCPKWMCPNWSHQKLLTYCVAPGMALSVLRVRQPITAVLLFAALVSSACGSLAPAPKASGAKPPKDQAAAPPDRGGEPAAVRAAGSPTPAAKSVTVNTFAPPDAFGGNWAYFRETGHYVAGGFKQYFDANGRIDAFGYPITEELVEDGWTVQYFQRARLEYHPESPAAPVQRALLGDMLRQRYRAQGDARGSSSSAGTTSTTGTTANTPMPDGARLFPETGAWVAPPVLQFFDRNGGLDVFGYPAAAPQDGVQWFQRARLEVNGGTVQAALIGDEYLDVAGLGDVRTRAQPPRLARADVSRITDELDVFASPGAAERATRLPADAQVRVTGELTGAGGEGWYAIRLWNAVDGFVRRDGLAFTPAPDKRPGPDVAPWKPPQPPAQGPFPLQARGSFVAASDYATTPDGPAAGRTSRGASAAVTAWATDVDGAVWFQFQGTGTSSGSAGWALASSLPLGVPTPAAAGDPKLSVASGKGMWFTYDTLRSTPPANLVAAA